MHLSLPVYATYLIFEVPLAQVDLMGDLNGFLAAHPLSPIVSLHHIEAIYPLFPGTNRAQGLKRLSKAIKVDPYNILQQSICYSSDKEWSFSVSWGYMVHVYKGFIPPHELEVPQLTFMSWHKRRESYAFPMNTRPRPREICDEPANFYMVDAKPLNESFSYSAYVKNERPNRLRSCQEKLMPMSLVDKIFVESEPVRDDWFQVQLPLFIFCIYSFQLLLARFLGLFCFVNLPWGQGNEPLVATQLLFRLLFRLMALLVVCVSGTYVGQL